MYSGRHTYDDLRNDFDLQDHLKELGLDVKEAADILGVAEKTVRRWLSKEGLITGPAIASLRALRTLNYYQVAWRPNEVELHTTDWEGLAKDREQRAEMKSLSDRAEKLGFNLVKKDA